MVGQAAWLQPEQRSPLVLDRGCVCVCLRVRQYVCVRVVATLCFPALGLAGQSSGLTNMGV